MNKRKTALFVICFNLLVLAGTAIWTNSLEQESILFQDVYTGNKWLKMDAADVVPGVYRVTVQYETDRTGCTLGMETEKKQYRLLQSDQYRLSPDKNELSFNIWLNYRTDILSTIVDCGEAEKGDTYLTVQVAIDRSRLGSLSFNILKALLMLGIVDVFVCGLAWKEWIRKKYYTLLGLGMIIFVSSLGVMSPSLVSGHDISFHLSRIWGLGRGLATGAFPVRVQPEWCNGYGYPVSIFYGDALMYFPAALTLLKVPLYTAYKIYVIAVNVGTTLIAYFCFKKISGSEKAGVICSATYTLSIYRLCNLYLREAAGEYTAMVFIPLVILGMWEILVGDVERKDYQTKWVYLCLGMSGIVQHVLTCEMTGIFLIFTCVIFIKRVFRKQVIIVLMKSVLATLLLNAWFLVPLLDYARETLNVFAEKEIYGLQEYGMSIYELFSINTTGGGSVLFAKGDMGMRMPVSLGLVFIFAFLLALTVTVKSGRVSGGERRSVTGIMILAAISVWFASDVFPWDRVENVTWLRQIAGSVQFPFRYLTIATGCIALLLCVSLKVCWKSEKMEKYLPVLLAGGLIVCVGQAMQYQDHVIRENGNIVVYDGTVMTEDPQALYGGEFCYVGTDYEKAAGRKNIMTDAEVTATERRGNQFTVSCHVKEESYLRMPLFYYPDYRCVDVESKEKMPVIKGENNELWVKIPAGYQGTVRVAFAEPWTWRGAEVVSLLALAGTAYYCLKEMKRKGRMAGQENR